MDNEIPGNRSFFFGYRFFCSFFNNQLTERRTNTFMTNNLKQALLKEARLLSISQSDCDLFFIGQANTITYKQLAKAAIHGGTTTSGRLGLKKLEKEGFLAARTIPGRAGTKYYFLTAKGRKRVERIFGGAF